MRAVCTGTARNAAIAGLGNRDSDLIVHDAPWIIVPVRDDVLWFHNSGILATGSRLSITPFSAADVT